MTDKDREFWSEIATYVFGITVVIALIVATIKVGS